MKPMRGLVLLVVVGALGILAVLATSFVTLARLERRASQQRLHSVKALLLARSGIEDALARLTAGQDPTALENGYGGERWDPASSGPLTAFESAQEVFRAGILDVETCPVRHALRPSFFSRALPAPTPATDAVNGKFRGHSGLLAGDLAPGGNAYAIKVEDESAKIHVNGGFLDTQDRDGDGIPDHRDPDVRTNPANPKDTGMGWNFQLARILDVLGQQPELGIANLGMLALQNRPVGGYRTLAQLQAASNTTLDLSPWITLSTWTDRQVLHPNGYAGEPGCASLSDVKKGRCALGLEAGGRPPVNLNAAARPVLAALISGLQGTTWHRPGIPEHCEYSPTITSGVVSAILDFRSGRDLSGCFAAAGLQPAPFRTWGAFGAFCDSLVPSVIHTVVLEEGNHDSIYGGGNLNGADLLKANFDPNADLNKNVPDQLLWKWIDKSDLVAWSTEGSLGPTGTFRISAVGRVLDREGRLLAQATLGQTAEAYALLRQTSQRDFVAGRRTDLTPSSYLSLSTDALLQTSGASASAWDTLAPGRGLAVTTYPSPPTALPARPSVLDGCVGLATVDMPSGPFLGNSPRFLHHFDDTWAADVGAAPGRMTPGPGSPASDAFLQDNLAGDLWPDPAAPGTANEPNTWYPDGLHAQYCRAPAYDALANLPPATFPAGIPANRGVVSYWVKPVEFFGMSTIDFSCVRGDCNNFLGTQALATGRAGKLLWGLLIEASDDDSDTNHERQYRQVPPWPRLPGARWRLVTARWDTDETNWAQGWDAFLDLKGVGITATPDPSGSSYGSPIATALNDNLLLPGMRFVLGGAGYLGYANQVLDEFAIFEFDDKPQDALDLCAQLASRRYQDGRYYKGNDGAFLSSQMEADPSGAVRLLQARWTEYLPRENRQEAVKDPASSAPAFPAPRALDSSLRRTGLELALLDPSGAVLTPLAQDARLDRRLRRWAYRVTFRTDVTTTLPTTEPVLETPFFDDITFAWQRASGARILASERP